MHFNNQVNNDTLKHAKSMEEVGDSFLQKMNFITGWFDKLLRQEHFTEYDWSGFVNGKPTFIEVKVRNCDINTYSDIYIEKNKYAFLMKKYAECKLPLYINFFQDWDKFLIFNLHKIPEKKLIDHGNVKITIPDLDTYYYEGRYGIPTRFGSYYELDDNSLKYVQKWKGMTI